MSLKMMLCRHIVWARGWLTHWHVLKQKAEGSGLTKGTPGVSGSSHLMTNTQCAMALFFNSREYSALTTKTEKKVVLY